MLLRPAIKRICLHGGSTAARTILATVALAALAGCAATTEENKPAAAASTSGSKLSDIFATPDWARFAGEKSKSARAITPDDLIGADGSCAATRMATAQPGPETEGSNNSPVTAGAATAFGSRDPGRGRTSGRCA